MPPITFVAPINAPAISPAGPGSINIAVEAMLAPSPKAPKACLVLLASSLIPPAIEEKANPAAMLPAAAIPLVLSAFSPCCLNDSSSSIALDAPALKEATLLSLLAKTFLRCCLKSEKALSSSNLTGPIPPLEATVYFPLLLCLNLSKLSATSPFKSEPLAAESSSITSLPNLSTDASALVRTALHFSVALAAVSIFPTNGFIALFKDSN